MIWNICLILSLFVFILTVIISVYQYFTNKRKKKPGTIINALFVATAISAFILCLPVNVNAYGSFDEGFFVAIQNMLQVFSLDSSFSDFSDNVAMTDGIMRSIFLAFSAFLHFIAPVLTVSIVLSFFKNFLSYIRLYFGLYNTLYVFSELNEKSLELAKSCFESDKKNHKTPVIVFTDVFEDNQEDAYELITSAKGFSALLFKKDILTINFKRIRKSKSIYLFIIGSNESENIDHSLGLIEKYGYNPNARLYSFVSSTEGAILVSAATNEDVRMTVRRVNEPQSLIYHYIYNNDIYGDYIINDEGKKQYSILIFGFDRYGKEMLKALVWALQQNDIVLDFHIFSEDADSEDIFCSECPELMRLNGSSVSGEASYTITFHTDNNGNAYNALSRPFDEAVMAIPCATTAYVAYDSDEKNIELSLKLRRLFKQTCDNAPIINAVVRNPVKANAAGRYNLTNFRGDDYDINFIGNIKHTCSKNVIINSELENEARERHLEWYKKDNASKEVIDLKSKEFFRYEYYYKSSMASVIRQQARIRNKTLGADKLPDQRTAEERRSLMIAEHMGWNAYMRTEGYSYGTERDDIKKTHYDLVPYDELSKAEKGKDEM